MNIEFVEIQNFRRLKAIRIDFTKQTTLLVGANNSGKTSAMDALGWFLENPRRFHANDFTASNWAIVNKIGTALEAAADGASSTGPSLVDWERVLPSLDLWLRVAEDEIHYVNHLLPTLDWEGGLLGVRLRYEPTDVEDLSSQYLAARKKISETIGVPLHSSTFIRQHNSLLYLDLLYTTGCGSAASTVTVAPKNHTQILFRHDS